MDHDLTSFPFVLLPIFTSINLKLNSEDDGPSDSRAARLWWTKQIAAESNPPLPFIARCFLCVWLCLFRALNHLCRGSRTSNKRADLHKSIPLWGDTLLKACPFWGGLMVLMVKIKNFALSRDSMESGCWEILLWIPALVAPLKNWSEELKFLQEAALTNCCSGSLFAC